MADANPNPWQALAAALARAPLPEAASAQLRPLLGLLRDAVREGAFPCGVVAVARRGRLELAGAAGKYRIDPARSCPVAIDSVFDLASLTKIAASWLLTGWLEAAGRLDLGMTLDAAFAAADSPYSRDVTLAMLLSHTAGLPQRTRLDRYGAAAPSEVLRHILAEPLKHPPGTRVQYANRHFILLGEALAVLAGRPLAAAAAELWRRCGMLETFFNPAAALRDRVVTTEWTGSAFLRGVVHDENARRLGGIAGHAGAFSTARDLLILAATALGEGVAWNGERILRADYPARSFADLTQGLGERRGLAWRLGNFGGAGEPLPFHDGFTGTSLLVSPAHQLAIVLLTNAVQLGRDRSRFERFRRALFDEIVALS